MANKVFAEHVFNERAYQVGRSPKTIPQFQYTPSAIATNLAFRVQRRQLQNDWSKKLLWRLNECVKELSKSIRSIFYCYFIADRELCCSILKEVLNFPLSKRLSFATTSPQYEIVVERLSYSLLLAESRSQGLDDLIMTVCPMKGSGYCE